MIKNSKLYSNFDSDIIEIDRYRDIEVSGFEASYNQQFCPKLNGDEKVTNKYTPDNASSLIVDYDKSFSEENAVGIRYDLLAIDPINGEEAIISVTKRYHRQGH